MPASLNSIIAGAPSANARLARGSDRRRAAARQRQVVRRRARRVGVAGDAKPRLGQRLRAHRCGQLVELAHGRLGKLGGAEPKSDVKVDRGAPGVLG